MDDAEFWLIMGEPAAIKDDTDIEAQEAALAVRLRQLTDDELVSFKITYEKFHDDAYRWDLWDAAYFVGGGCSDDGFIDFRGWLMGRGEVVYRRAIKDPDSLADLDMGEDPALTTQALEWGGLPADIWDDRGSGRGNFYDQLPPRESPLGDPIGEQFDEGDTEASIKRFPRLFAKYGG